MPQAHLCVGLVPLFNHLLIEEQERIEHLLVHQSLKKGEMIFTPDSEPRLIIVAQGSMRVYRLAMTGKEHLIRVLETGEYEGENQLFGVENKTNFAEALCATEICILRQSDFNKLLLTYPRLALKLLEMNAKKASSLEQHTQYLMREKVEGRLAAYILDLMVDNHTKNISLPLKMKELAIFLGTRPETLSRKFRELEVKKAIQRNGREIFVTDIDYLEELT